MESTGIYWRPVYQLLEEEGRTLLLVNPQHMKAVPGRKTDVKDAQWLAELLRHGLVRPSLIPPQEQRDLRDLTRERTNFVRQRATLVNRVQKVLESANIKLGDVASNIMGLSGRAMLAALAAGETDAAKLADLAKCRLRDNLPALEAALTGQFRDHHRFLLGELLRQIDHLDATLAAFAAQIEAAVANQQEALALLDSIPGIAHEAAEGVLAEIGADMSRFPSAAHLAAWTGVAPGNNESAGKQRSSRHREGNTWIRTLLVQIARAAVRSRDTYLAAQYRRIARRRGDKRAIMAVAHTIVVIIYHILTKREPYRELGGDYFERQAPEVRARQLTRQLTKLGYEVELRPVPQMAPA